MNSKWVLLFVLFLLFIYLFITISLLEKKNVIQFWDFMMNGFEFSWSQTVWTENEFEFSWQTVVPNKANFHVESTSRYPPYKYSFICNENWISTECEVCFGNRNLSLCQNTFYKVYLLEYAYKFWVINYYKVCLLFLFVSI